MCQKEVSQNTHSSLTAVFLATAKGGWSLPACNDFLILTDSSPSCASPPSSGSCCKGLQCHPREWVTEAEQAVQLLHCSGSFGNTFFFLLLWAFLWLHQYCVKDPHQLAGKPRISQLNGETPAGRGERAGWLESLTSSKCGLPCFC